MIEFKFTDIIKDKTYLNEIIAISSEAFKISKNEYLTNLGKYKALLFLILLEDGVIKSLCKIAPDKDSKGCTVVSNVATDEKERGKGYGKLLMKEVIRVYKSVSLNAVKVSTLMFYLKIGFKVRDFTLLDDLKTEQPEGDAYGIEGKWSMEYSNRFRKTIFLYGENHSNQDEVLKIRNSVKMLVNLKPVILPEIYEEDESFYKRELKLKTYPLEPKKQAREQAFDMELPMNILFQLREGDMCTSITKALKETDYLVVIVGDTHLRTKRVSELGAPLLSMFLSRLSNINVVIKRSSLKEIE